MSKKMKVLEGAEIEGLSYGVQVYDDEVIQETLLYPCGVSISIYDKYGMDIGIHLGR